MEKYKLDIIIDEERVNENIAFLNKEIDRLKGKREKSKKTDAILVSAVSVLTSFCGWKISGSDNILRLFIGAIVISLLLFPKCYAADQSMLQQIVGTGMVNRYSEELYNFFKGRHNYYVSCSSFPPRDWTDLKISRENEDGTENCFEWSFSFEYKEDVENPTFDVHKHILYLPENLTKEQTDIDLNDMTNLYKYCTQTTK